jgi:tryptophan 2,3-dioxygenase
METNAAVAALMGWRRSLDPERFPYDEVVAALRARGKHFAAPELLIALDCVRTHTPVADRRLARFLDTALDKFDERFDNPSYLALAQLSLPGTDESRDDRLRAAHRRDRLLVLLLADVVRLERATTPLSPEMRPDGRTVAKRCNHALRAATPALERLGLDLDDVLDTATADELRTLQLSLLPVSEVHDEQMFMRVLQAYETSFGFMCGELAAAVDELERGLPRAAVRSLASAERSLRESKPLWSLMGTLQPEAFLRFREFTDGASAIQSRSYKTLESRCRRPDRERLDSPAYCAVPEVRERVLGGQANLDQALNVALLTGSICKAAGASVCAAMTSFEEAVMAWRRTHHRIAVRMLGERRGTGGSAGVAYLDEGRAIPVFDAPRCPLRAAA